MNNRAASKIWILVIGVVLLVGGWQYSVSKGKVKKLKVSEEQPWIQQKTDLVPKEEVKREKVKITEDKTANWKSYRSEKYKYKIQFPPDWQLNRGSFERDFVEFSDIPTHFRRGEVLKRGWIDFAILIIPTKHISLQEYLQELDKKREKTYEGTPSVKILKEKSIKVSNLGAVQRQEIWTAAGFPVISTYFLKNGLAFHLEMKFAKSGPNFTIYEIQPSDLELNDQILSTFKFLE